MRRHDIRRKPYRYSWEKRVGVWLLVAIIVAWAFLTV